MPSARSSTITRLPIHFRLYLLRVYADSVGRAWQAMTKKCDGCERLQHTVRMPITQVTSRITGGYACMALWLLLTAFQDAPFQDAALSSWEHPSTPRGLCFGLLVVQNASPLQKSVRYRAAHSIYITIGFTEVSEMSRRRAGRVVPAFAL